jgi:hypothetical protein
MSEFSFRVDRADLHKTSFDPQYADAIKSPLKAGEALLCVDAFALTANNITYGVAGDQIGYWQFFPQALPWGQIPVWGFGTIIASAVERLDVGQRFYGYYPMASHLRVEPAKMSPHGFVCQAEHRRALPQAYNQYSLASPELGFPPEEDRMRMLLNPLFTTAFLLAAQLKDAEYFSAQCVLLTSASSKTAMSLAYLLNRYHDVRVVGLTSKPNLDFVQSLGVYESVIAYEALEQLSVESAALIDIAGNAGVRARLHRHFADQLHHSSLVGITHYQADPGERTPLPGAEPTPFFAPSQAEKMIKKDGQDQFRAELAEQWAGFIVHADEWFDLKVVSDGAGLESVYRQVASNPSPTNGYLFERASS